MPTKFDEDVINIYFQLQTQYGNKVPEDLTAEQVYEMANEGYSFPQYSKKASAEALRIHKSENKYAKGGKLYDIMEYPTGNDFTVDEEDFKKLKSKKLIYRDDETGWASNEDDYEEISELIGQEYAKGGRINDLKEDILFYDKIHFGGRKGLKNKATGYFPKDWKKKGPIRYTEIVKYYTDKGYDKAEIHQALTEIGYYKYMAKGGVLDSDEKQEIDDFIDIDIHKYNEYDDLGIEPPTYDEYADSVIEYEITDKSKRDAVLEYIKETLGKRDEYNKYWKEQDYTHTPSNKTFLCIEDGEEFTIEAPNLAQAREDCSMWNAEVVRELGPNEVIDPNQADMEVYEKGGDLDKEFKFDSNFIIYVPSTSDVSSQISKDELNSRVEEVKEFVSNHFGGYTETQADGGYKSDSGDVVEEDVVKVSVFAKEKDWENRENLIVAQVKEWANKWGQEAIGFEYEDADGKRKLYYIDREGKKGFGGFLFGTAVGGYAGYKYGLTKDKRDRADLFRTEQKYYGRAKSEYQDYKDRKRKGGPDIVDVDYEEFAKGGKVGRYTSDDMPNFLDKIFNKDFIENVLIQADQMDINFKNDGFIVGEKDIKAVEKKGWTFDSLSTYGTSGISLLFTRKSYAKGGNLPVDVKVYANDKGIYTIVDADSVFEMTDDFKGKYIGELTDFPSDITHWGKMIDIKEMSKPMQMGISQLKKI